MGLLGGLLLFGGLGLVLVGLVGVVVGAFGGQWGDVGFSAVILAAGLISGGAGTAILE